MLPLVKTHAYGNDFLLVEQQAMPSGRDPADIARAACDRHRGIGADGLIAFTARPRGARMRLWNADGSRSEVSGNGVRCLAAWIAIEQRLDAGADLVIETDAGPKLVELMSRPDDDRWVCRTAMGQPTNIEKTRIALDGSSEASGDAAIDVVTLSVGNPHCVIVGAATEEGLARFGPVLAVHPRFPEGTNVELVEVERPDRLRLLIWERGVGPTSSSGTGTCAAAVAAVVAGGAARTVDVSAPGGTQRVEWTEAGLFLTGWASIVATATFRP